MANAAKNLTPVTLELGGKSPAIVAPDFPIKTAAERILWAKTFNAGQVCLAVDHVFLPRGAETEFVAHCKRLFAKRYPDINGPDFTSIIDQRSYDRLTAALEDARAKGATLINLAEGQTPDAVEAQVPAASRPEPDRRDGDHAARDLRSDPADPGLRRAAGGGRRRQCGRPAARHLSLHQQAPRRATSTSRASCRAASRSTMPIMHVAQHDLPFGGVGASGMGHYHGREGFDTFSKLRPGLPAGADVGGPDDVPAALSAAFRAGCSIS